VRFVTELQFKGKEFVYNHHLTVPHRPLVVDAAKGIGAPRLDGNLIIQGDNLHALKALLPTHAGRVDCIFIDPPYNTGNEGWAYNDNVNSPMIKEWLAANPIGIEDGLRHDKWCAMMWPRLRLLWELLAEGGTLWVTLDDNEAHLSVHLYYRRESHSGQKTWVLISKVNCLPDRGDNGAMVVAFREKAKRELSKFKAPVFPLPSAFALNRQLHRVVHARGEGGGGGDGRGGGRAAPRILGEVKFYVKDLLKSDARQLSTSLTVVNTQTKYGEVASKSGQVVGAAAGVQR
jgi:hypothetical protein